MIFPKLMPFLGILYLISCSKFSKTTVNAVDIIELNPSCPQRNYPQCGNYKIKILPTLPTLLGTSPHWNDESRSVYYMDAFRLSVQRYFIDSGVFVTSQGSQLLKFELPTDLYNPVQFFGFIIPSNVPDKYVMNFGDELGVLSWDGKSILSDFKEINQPDPTHPFPFFVLHDGKVGPNGVLFFYSVPVPFGSLLPVNPAPIQTLTPQNQSTLFGICNKKQKPLLTGYKFSSGIGFSPNGKWFYHNDGIRRIMYKSYYDQANCLMKNTTILLDFGKENIRGFPLGLTVDNQGYVWVTCFLAGQILKIDPEKGNVICMIKTPLKTVGDVTFGRCPDEKQGKLSCMYATTAFENSTTQLDDITLPPSLQEGSLMLIRDFGAEGQLDMKVNLKDVIDSTPY